MISECGKSRLSFLSYKRPTPVKEKTVFGTLTYYKPASSVGPHVNPKTIVVVGSYKKEGNGQRARIITATLKNTKTGEKCCHISVFAGKNPQNTLLILRLLPGGNDNQSAAGDSEDAIINCDLPPDDDVLQEEPISDPLPDPLPPPTGP